MPQIHDPELPASAYFPEETDFLNRFDRRRGGASFTAPNYDEPVSPWPWDFLAEIERDAPLSGDRGQAVEDLNAAWESYHEATERFDRGSASKKERLKNRKLAATAHGGSYWRRVVLVGNAHQRQLKAMKGAQPNANKPSPADIT